MPLFRFYRGNRFFESLETTIIIKNMSQLRDAIYKDWEMWEGALRKNDDKPFSKDCFGIKIEPYHGMDKLTGWYTQLVSCDLEKKDEFMAIGYLSEPLEPIVIYVKNDFIPTLIKQPPNEDGSISMWVEQKNGDFYMFSKGSPVFLEIPGFDK